MAQTMIEPKNIGIYLAYKKLSPGPQNCARDANESLYFANLANN